MANPLGLSNTPLEKNKRKKVNKKESVYECTLIPGNSTQRDVEDLDTEAMATTQE